MLNRQTIAALLVLLAAGARCDRATAGPDAAAAGPQEPGGRSGEDTGLYLGYGLTREGLDLDFDGRAAVSGTDISFDAWGLGQELALGYAFGPRFRTELSVFGVDRRSRPAGSDVKLGVVRLTAIMPLVTHGCLRPHLLAGFGVAAAAIEGEGFEERIYLMTNGHAGLGARLKLHRRFFLQLDYLYTVIDVERELRDLGGDDENTRFVGGDGRSHTFRACLNYDF